MEAPEQAQAPEVERERCDFIYRRIVPGVAATAALSLLLSVWLFALNVQRGGAEDLGQLAVHQPAVELQLPGALLRMHVAHGKPRVPGGLRLDVRHVGFVEEQMPIFSKECLRRLKHTMRLTKSGWGLGIAWTSTLGHPEDKMGVIDAAPIGHHRPLKAGEMYTQVLPAMGLTARQELDAMRSRYQEDMRLVEFDEVPLDPRHPLTPERLARQRR